MLDADKVIEWIDEHVPTKFEDMANYVQQFKEDFGLIHISEGLVKQVNEVHEYPPTTKEDIRKALMSISTEEYEELWKVTFGETYEQFVDKLLDN